MIDFDFNKDYILEDERARLEPLTEAHIELLLPMAREQGMWTYSLDKCHTPEGLTTYVRATLENRIQKKEYPFVVFDKKAGKIAGSTRFHEINGAIRSMRMGYTWYGQQFQGTGLNKHCKYLMFEFAFEQLHFERIGLAAYIDNKRSIAAMKSVGCIQEGVFRGLLPALDGNGRTDAILFSILKTDWSGGAKDKLKDKLGTKA